MTIKITTDEQAIASVQEAVEKMMKMGSQGGRDKPQEVLAEQFKGAKKEVEEEWHDNKEVIEDMVLTISDEEDSPSVNHEEINKELLKTQAELKARDDAIAKMQKMIDDLSDRAAKQQRMEQDRVLDTIEQHRKQAVKNGDYDAVLKLDQQKAHVLGQGNNLDPVYADFLKRNPWWNGTTTQEIKMRIAANQYDNILTQRQLPPAQAIALLEDYIKTDFPEYFDKSDKKDNAIAAVEGNIKAGIVKNSKRSYTVDNLDKQTKFIVNEFARLGKVDTKKYTEELAKAGLIK